MVIMIESKIENTKTPKKNCHCRLLPLALAVFLAVSLAGAWLLARVF